MENTIRIEGEIEMGEGCPIVFWRRVVTNDGSVALELTTPGHISVHGSSMNSVYVTTAKEYLVAGPRLPSSPRDYNPDTPRLQSTLQSA